MKTRLPLSLLAALLAAFPSAIAAPAGTDLGNVMYVGDSITHGMNSGTYRWALHKIFADNGISYHAEGVNSGGVTAGTSYGGQVFNNEHSSQASARAWEISGRKTGSRFDGSNISNWLGLSDAKANGAAYQGPTFTGTDMLKNFYVKNDSGSSVPLSTLVKITDIKGPEFLLRQNLYNSSKLMVTPAQGYSNSQAMEALEQTFEASMPTDMGYSYADMSYQEQKIQNGIGIVQIFLLSSVFVFLILAALYERWSLPLSIFMTVPIAALGAFLGLYWFGYELNLYAQIGLVMLIGLAAKNAILIVEFAVIEMERGKTLMEATLSAARIRLRPILMTSFAFILGCVPLALASGSGAYSRNIIGIVVIAGMTMATVVGVFLIPCSFYFIMKLFRVRIARKTVETEDPDEIIARKHLFHEAHESLKG